MATGMEKLKKLLSNKIAKIGWYLKGVKLPERGAISYTNFCIHTEALYDNRTYSALLSFSKEFFAYTGHRIIVCVTTPICPILMNIVNGKKLSQDMFMSRVLNLGDFAEIGYHGHFNFENTPIRLHKDSYNKNIVRKQIDEEMSWFRGIGVNPKSFISGCWFLSKDIILDLERSGIEIDMSVRKGKADTFGGIYLDDVDIPDYGKPFILPPSKNILEIQSVFGPVMPPPLMKGHLSEYLRKGEESGERYFVFPLHDWDILKYHRNIWANIRELAGHKEKIRWLNVSNMRDRYFGVKTGVWI